MNGELYVADPLLQDLENTLFNRLFVYPGIIPNRKVIGISMVVNGGLEGICVIWDFMF